MPFYYKEHSEGTERGDGKQPGGCVIPKKAALRNWAEQDFDSSTAAWSPEDVVLVILLFPASLLGTQSPASFLGLRIDHLFLLFISLPANWV